MNRQKTTFFLIIGAAVILVGVVLALRGRPGAAVVATMEPALPGTVTLETLVPGVLSGGRTWNGVQIEVVSAEEDGWSLVQAYNQFNEPPLPGKRMLLVTVRVSKVEDAGKEPVTVDEADFKVVGERGVVYTTYGDETRYSVVPDALGGMVTPEYSLSGAICVQAPKDEKGFVLIYEPFVGNEPAVYIPLPSE